MSYCLNDESDLICELSTILHKIEKREDKEAFVESLDRAKVGQDTIDILKLELYVAGLENEWKPKFGKNVRRKRKIPDMSNMDFSLP